MTASTGKVAGESVELQARSTLEVSAVHRTVCNDAIEARALGCGRGSRKADARSSAEDLRNGSAPFIAIAPKDGMRDAGNPRGGCIQVGAASAGAVGTIQHQQPEGSVLVVHKGDLRESAGAEVEILKRYGVERGYGVYK